MKAFQQTSLSGFSFGNSLYNEIWDYYWILTLSNLGNNKCEIIERQTRCNSNTSKQGKRALGIRIALLLFCGLSLDCKASTNLRKANLHVPQNLWRQTDCCSTTSSLISSFPPVDAKWAFYCRREEKKKKSKKKAGLVTKPAHNLVWTVKFNSHRTWSNDNA